MPVTRCRIIVVCVVAVVTLAAPAAGIGDHQTERKQIHSCGIIYEPGDYVLAEDLRNDRGGACLLIATGHVTLDGQGHEVNGSAGPGDSSHIGVLVSTTRARNEVTVRNLTAVGFGSGVVVSNLSIGSVADVTARENSFNGVLVKDSTNVAVRNTTAADNTGNGVTLLESVDSAVTGSNVRSNGGDGVRVIGGATVFVDATRATENLENGVLVRRTAGATVANVTAADNGLFGVSANRGTDVTSRGLTAIGNGLSGVLFRNVTDGAVNDLDAIENGQSGLYVLDGARVSATGIDARRNRLDGVSVVDASGVTVSDADIEASGGAGLRIAASSQVHVKAVAASNNALAEVIGVANANTTGGDVVIDGTRVSFDIENVSLDATTAPALTPRGMANVGGYLRVSPLGETAHLDLTVHYGNVTGIDEGSLGLWRHDRTWSELADSGVDTEQNAVTGSLDPTQTTVVAVFSSESRGDD